MRQKGFSSLVVILSGFLILGAIGVGGYYFYQQYKLRSITDFESCAKYYPVLLSYPGQCNTPDGRHFVQTLSAEEKKKLTPSPIMSPSDVILPKQTNEPKLLETVRDSMIIQEEPPELFSKVEWQATASGLITVWDSSKFDDVGNSKGIRVESKLLKDVPEVLADEFLTYYEDTLKAKGWVENESAWADGVDGWQRGFKRDKEYINLIYDGVNNGPNRKGSVFVVEYVVLH